MTPKPTRTHTVLGLLATVSLVAWIGGAAAASDQAACQVSLAPETVQAGDESVDLAATPSKPIGTLVSAQIDDESAALVEVVEQERGQEGQYGLALDLRRAEAGSWTVTLRGVHGQCTGTLRVEERAGS